MESNEKKNYRDKKTNSLLYRISKIRVKRFNQGPVNAPHSTLIYPKQEKTFHIENIR
jgi:hypothetical protein